VQGRSPWRHQLRDQCQLSLVSFPFVYAILVATIFDPLFKILFEATIIFMMRMCVDQDVSILKCVEEIKL
jgi:hypothetical protein